MITHNGGHRPHRTGASRSRMLLIWSMMAFSAGSYATESGTSVYLLGSRGPMAAMLPPAPGFYLQNDVYYYNGNLSGDRTLPAGGRVLADLDGEVWLDLLTGLYVYEDSVLGGKLAVAGILPVGHIAVDASAELDPVDFDPISFDRHDSASVIGDPLVNAMLGWNSGSLFWNASMLVNVPIGNYRENHIANIAFNRWAVDLSGAVTWYHPTSGTEFSLVTGMTFNGTNDETDYDSGDEVHIEWSASTSLNEQFTVGLLGYHHKQVSGDSGDGALLGSFKGRVNAIGATVGYNLMLGKVPLSTRLKVFEEFDAKNRMEGTAAFLTVSLPL